MKVICIRDAQIQEEEKKNGDSAESVEENRESKPMMTDSQKPI